MAPEVKKVSHNPPYGKRWRLYILSQYLANLAEPFAHIERSRKPYFGEIHPCTNKIVYARFEVFRPFLCVFMSGFRIFVHYELWVMYQSPSFSVRWIQLIGY